MSIFPRTRPIESKTPIVLDGEFYSRKALIVARDLLGKYLVRQEGNRLTSAIIRETEAYVGPHDLACHAAKGRTARTEVMFGSSGVWYVYFVYGIHWMLNVVTDGEDYPAAVLIRAAGDWTGPARLTKAMAIDKQFNGKLASLATKLWIEDRGYHPKPRQIERTPRIGVDYAKHWAEKPYRFLLTNEG